MEFPLGSNEIGPDAERRTWTAYKRAPIVEAVIDIQFHDPLAFETLDRIQKKFLVDFPLSQPQRQLIVEVEGDEVATRHDLTGLKLTTKEGLDMILLGPRNFTTSRLAPYISWEDLRSKARHNWDVYKGVVGYRKIARIAVRYINRIDIPLDQAGSADLEHYLLFFPKTPDALHVRLNKYTMQVVSSLPADDCTVLINSGTIEPVLVNHGAILFDIDLYRTTNVPQNDSDLWEFIERLRDHKNRIFEASITDKARELFR